MNNLHIYYRAAGVCGIHFNNTSNPSVLFVSEIRQNVKSLNFPGGKKMQYRVNFNSDLQTIKKLLNNGKDEGIIDIYIKNPKHPFQSTVVNFKNNSYAEKYLNSKLKDIKYDKEEKDFEEYNDDSEMDPVKTANREFKEETNINHFSPVKSDDPFIYIPSAKYCLYFCKLPDDFNEYIINNDISNLKLVPYDLLWKEKVVYNDFPLSNFSSMIIKTPQFKTEMDKFILLKDINKLSFDNNQENKKDENK